MALHTRSGGQATRVVGSWDDEPAARWNEWIGLHRTDALPSRAAYELRRLAAELTGLPQPDAAAITIAEASRILSRKRAQHGERPMEIGAVGSLLARLEGGRQVESLMDLANELIVAGRIADTKDIGEGPLERATSDVR